MLRLDRIRPQIHMINHYYQYYIIIKPISHLADLQLFLNHIHTSFGTSIKKEKSQTYPNVIPKQALYAVP